MDAWPALLVPLPKPHLFAGKKRLYQPTAPSPSSFMSSLADGTQKRRKLTKTSSPPPEIQPLSFEHEPMLDMTTNIFNFFPPHDASNVNDNVHFFTLNGDSTTLDGNLVSQPMDHAQVTNTHFPHAIITSLSQTFSPTPVNPNSSLVAVSMPSNAGTSQSEANSSFFNFPNPLGYISRKLNRRRRTTRIPKSASTPIIPSEATPSIDSIPSFSSAPTTVPNPTSSRSIPILSSPNPSCPPPLPALITINELHPATDVTDNLILASSTVPPQHAPKCSHLQAENRDPAPNPIVHVSEISSACYDKFPKLPHELTGRLDISVPRHKPELASTISAGITEVTPQSGFQAPEYSERAFSSKHFQLPASSSSFEPSTFYMRDTDLEATRSDTSHYDNQKFQAIPIVAGTYKASGENSNQYHNCIVDRTTDDRTENKEILLHPTLNHSVVPASALQQHRQFQDLQCNGWVSVAPLLPAPPTMITTSSSHGHGWSSSALSHRQDQALSPSTSGEEEGTVADVAETQELPLGSGSKPVGPDSTLSKWKWKKGLCSMSGEETVANNKSYPGINQAELGLSTARCDGDSLSRGGSCSLQLRQHISELESNKVNCEASQLISSTPTDDSAVTITHVTAFASLLGPVAHPESGTKYLTETSVVAANTDNHKWIKNSPKAKFIIGDLEEGAGDFPVSNTSTVVRGEPECATLEHPITAALRPRLLRRKPITDEGSYHSEGRRWTLASALTDAKISDAGLVRVLDRMRDDTNGQEGNRLDVEKVILEGWGIPDAEVGDGSKDDMRKVANENVQHGHTPSLEYGSYPLQTEASSKVDAIDRGFRSKIMKQHNRSHSTPSQAWIAAQRALLTCRELILTERNYVAQLSLLVQQQTATPPPPLMCEYAKELLQACERVLKRMERDPSARGVSRAFLEGEEEVQGAYVMWCGAVGGWFSVDGSGQDGSARLSLDFSEVSNRVRQLSLKRRNRVGSKTDVDKPTSPVTGSEGEDASINQLKRTVSTWRKSVPTLGFETPALYGGGDRKKEKESERESTSPSARKPGVRELAILPTQRVMRYALIYQELLSHTPPTSPSRTFVERAAHAATRIAEKCDLAQGNTAFIASYSNGGGSHTRSSSRTGTQTSLSRVPPLPTTTLVATESVAYDPVPASPSSMQSAVDSPFRSSTQVFQSTNNKSNHSEIVTSRRRLSVSFMWGKGNKQKIPAPSESIQVLHTTAGVSSLAYDA